MATFDEFLEEQRQKRKKKRKPGEVFFEAVEDAQKKREMARAYTVETGRPAGIVKTVAAGVMEIGNERKRKGIAKAKAAHLKKKLMR